MGCHCLLHPPHCQPLNLQLTRHFHKLCLTRSTKQHHQSDMAPRPEPDTRNPSTPPLQSGHTFRAPLLWPLHVLILLCGPFSHPYVWKILDDPSRSSLSDTSFLKGSESMSPPNKVNTQLSLLCSTSSQSIYALTCLSSTRQNKALKSLIQRLHSQIVSE